ncbi:MAG: arylsulfatase [Planctomycetota bacterium]|nr:arylsulfatase [Planctomycetota bacterium]
MRHPDWIQIVAKRAALVVIALVMAPVCLAAEASNRPNIVFILADDLGSGDLGCYNSNSKIPTPAFDELAAGGMRFTDAHTPSSVCSPTRYGVLTGRYAWRSRLKQGVLWGYSRSLIEPGRTTVASLLKQQGYTTACVGKWHLGFQTPDLAAKDLPPASAVLPENHPHAVDYAKPLLPGPNTVGFDYFFGIPSSLDMEPYVYVENDRPLEQPTETIAKSEHRRNGGGGFWRGGPIAPSFKHIDVLPTITAKATAWIGEQSADKPFFLYFPLNAPHTPWLPTDEFRGKSQAGYYGDFVTQVDWVVRQVMNSLDEHGFDDNTLLIVTSDNGSHWPVGDIEKWQHAANLHYRGQKADIWEGGHHVPFIARWPGKIKAGSQSSETICLTDLMATAAAVSDVTVPDDAGEDSFNLLPALLGQPLDKPIREATVHHSMNGTFSIRSGDWKLVADNLGSGGFTAPRVVKPEAGGPGGQLYNLADDPTEATNVWIEYPDIVARLSARLTKLQAAGRSR